MQLALAADEDFARAPVNVVELDRDNPGSAKSEPRHDQQHRVVAAPDGVVGANRLDQPLDLFGLEVARQMVGAGGHARQAVGEIAPGLAAPEQELEQTAQMRRQRFVAAGLRSGFKLAQESHDIVRRDRVQVPELVAEAKGREPLQEARAVSDRGLGQSPLSAQVDRIFVAEVVQRRCLFRRRLRDSRYTGFAQMFDEASQAELGISARAAGDPAQYRVPKAFHSGAIEVTDPKSAFLDCLAQPAGYRPISLDRSCLVALRPEPLQKSFAMRPRPSRLISPFAARIPRDCHLPLLSSWRKARPLVSEDQFVSDSEPLRSSHPGSIGGATPRVS